MRPILRISLVILLMSPYLFLTLFVRHISLPAWSVVSEALVFTLSQSIVSSTLAVLFGVLGAMGWAAFSSNWQKGFLAFLIVPQVIPGIAIVVSLLNIVHPFPLGWYGVVLAHTLMNTGLAAVMMVIIFKMRIDPSWLQQARVLGASRLRLWFNLLRYELFDDILRILVFICFQCSISFVIPLILGGVGNKSLEVLVYESIRQHNEWSTAIGLALIQVALMSAFCYSLWRLQPLPSSKNTFDEPVKLREWGFKILIVPAVVGNFVVCSGLFINIWESFERLEMIGPLQRSLWSGTLGTVSIAGLVGVCTLGLLAWVTYIYPHRGMRKLMLFYISPGAVLTGFGLLVMSEQHVLISFAKIVFGVTLAMFPWIYRSMFDGAWVRLHSQVRVAQTLGAQASEIFWKITWPQLRGAAYSASALACFWASGEFAITTLLSEGDWTLSVIIDRLLGSYRIDLALAAVVLMIFAGGIASLLLWMCQYVSYKKPAR